MSLKSLIRLQSGESGTGLGPLVEFYSKLPKGSVAPRVGGIKGRFFAGENASGKPIVALLLGVFAVGYTLDYNSASIVLSCIGPILIHSYSALEYAVCS